MDRARFSDPGSAATNGHAYGAIVYRASGMVAVQSNRSPKAALALMVAYAVAHGRGVDALALDVIAGRVRFNESGEGRINAA
jgi:hypothetical protein